MPWSSKKKQQTLDVQRATCIHGSSIIIPVIMLQQDIMTLILEKLGVKELLLCSLVCRGFLRTIDANNRSLFNQSLRWWSLYDATYKEEDIIKFNPSTVQYEHVQHVNPKGVHKWLMNIVPTVGAIVHMRLNLQLALERVELTGKLHHVNNIIERGCVSIDALEWEVLEVKHCLQSHVCKGRTAQVQMQVLSFVHNNKQVKLRMLETIIVNFENVPVQDKITPLRVLCVIKCVHQCMHCHQRRSKWRSVDNVAAEHRVLCSVCMEELYVEEKKLHTKWKILGLPRNTEHLFFVQQGKHNFVKFNLKKDVAMVLGHENWAQMLQNNRLRNRRKTNKNNRFSHFDFSSRWF